MVVAAGGGKHLRQRKFFKNRKVNTIYEYLRSVVPILRYLGLLPVKKIHENGIVKYKPYLGVLYILQILCECILVIYLTVILIQNLSSGVTSPYSFNTIEIFACIMFAAHIIATKIKSIQYRKDCVESFDALYEVDINFRKLGIDTSYKKLITISRSLILSAFVGYPILFVYTFKNISHFIVLLLQIWRLCSINMFAIFVFLLYSKYRKLNEFLNLYIKENEEGIPLTKINLEPLEVINTIAEIYDKLCISGQNWNNIHNIALAINLLLYSIGATLFSIAYYRTPYDMGPMIPVCVFLFMEFFYVLTITQITVIECHKIMLNVNEMSCCYIDNDLWQARNSFLLQTLHQRVRFTVVQVFPLDYTIAVKIGGIVLSVLVLHIQIESLEDFK